MWMLRVLSGQEAGKTIQLTPGKYKIGRDPDSHIPLMSSKISKHHATLEVTAQGVKLIDNNSTNGTFVNGIRINAQNIYSGDKVAFHDLIVDFTQATSQAMGFATAMPDQFNPEYEQQQQVHQNSNQQASNSKVQVPTGLQGILHLAKSYVDDVVMPGVYKLAELMEFKWLLASFVAAFIIFVTIFSSIPLMEILKESIELESRQRASTIARTLALINQSHVASGNNTSVSIQYALTEAGSIDAYVINSLDGSIIAPINQIGQALDVEYVHEARKQSKKSVKQINDETIVAVHPIDVYNSQSGKSEAKAFAVVVYKMGKVAVNDKSILSLFIQTLFIAILLGSILYFFLYKIIDYPIKNLNKQLDYALKESSDHVESHYQYPSLQSLISNINTSLNRALASAGLDDMNQFNTSGADRMQEMEHITNLIGFPALAIHNESRLITAMNMAMEEKINMSALELMQAPVDKLLDQAFKESIHFLIEQCENQPNDIHSNQLEFSGLTHEVTAKAVFGDKEISYYVIVILPMAEEVAS